jgi:hypothetical protein
VFVCPVVLILCESCTPEYAPEYALQGRTSSLPILIMRSDYKRCQLRQLGHQSCIGKDKQQPISTMVSGVFTFLLCMLCIAGMSRATTESESL